MSRILVGSCYFFSCYEDFIPHDIDEVEIIDTNDFYQTQQITGQGYCLFRVQKQKCKDDYIDWALYCGLGMAIGKFLVPEFAKEIGMTIDDLKRHRLHNHNQRYFYVILLNPDDITPAGEKLLTNLNLFHIEKENPAFSIETINIVKKDLQLHVDLKYKLGEVMLINPDNRTLPLYNLFRTKIVKKENKTETQKIESPKQDLEDGTELFSIVGRINEDDNSFLYIKIPSHVEKDKTKV